MGLPNVTKNYRTALTITGIVTFIATYHYFRIFNTWVEAFNVSNKLGDGITGEYMGTLTGAPFNDAYRYVDWLLTVPLLLIELILVMKLPKSQTVDLAWKLGVASAVMVALGYPGEIQDALLIRWIFWALAMIPFCYVVFTVVAARWVTAISWLTYPFVYIIKSCGLKGSIATTYEQIGYSLADFVAKAVFGVLIWAIAANKSAEEEK